MKKFFATVATFFSVMILTAQTVWKKRYPKAKRAVKKQWMIVKAKVTPILMRSWRKFMSRKIDVQIAIVLSLMSVLALAFATWPTIIWLTIASFIAWAVVWREEVTKPAIAWVWKTSKPARDAFTAWLSKVLFFGYGIPIAMIGWGVICFLGFGITFNFSKGLASMFGMAGFTGVIFGVFFYGAELHHKNCNERRAKEAKALAKTRGARSYCQTRKVP